MKRTKPYTAAETAYAKRLFATASARGTLKPPRTNAVLVTGSGHRQTAMQQRVTWRDYLRDARGALRRGR